MSRTLGVLATALLVAVMASGCKKVTQGAKEHFSQDFTCPIERVEVRERPDIHPSDFEDRPVPSKEIASDPERLKMWQAEQDKRRASTDSGDEIIEARGCNHQKLYACHRHNKDTGYIMCSSRKYPVGMTPW